MIFLSICGLAVILMLGYYLYRQMTDPGPKIFPYNDVLAARKTSQPGPNHQP